MERAIAYIHIQIYTNLDFRGGGFIDFYDFRVELAFFGFEVLVDLFLITKKNQ